MTTSIAVYGASGHTGGFVLAALRARGYTPIALGRADATPDNPAALDRALRPAAAVINCAGPFAITATSLIDSAIRAGIPYVDVCAEIETTADTLTRYATAPIPVLPATAFFGTLADLLTTAALTHHTATSGPATGHIGPGPASRRAVSSDHAATSGPATHHLAAPGPATHRTATPGPFSDHAAGSGPAAHYAAPPGHFSEHAATSGSATHHLAGPDTVAHNAAPLGLFSDHAACSGPATRHAGPGPAAHHAATPGHSTDHPTVTSAQRPEAPAPRPAALAADEVQVAYALSNWHPTPGTRTSGAVSRTRRDGRRVRYTEGRLAYHDTPPTTETWPFPDTPRPVTTDFTMTDVVTIPHHIAVPEVRTHMSANAAHDVVTSTAPPTAQAFLVDVHIRTGAATLRATATGTDIYAVTAPMAVEAVHRLLTTPHLTGATTAAALFPAPDFLAALAPHITVLR